MEPLTYSHVLACPEGDETECVPALLIIEPFSWE